jgi:Phage-integrase repeat unit
LKSTAEWDAYCKSGKKPPDIPISPHAAYANMGWVGVRDWLTDNPQYRSFEKARSFVHRLDLKSTKEWNAYCTSGKKPADIPSGPSGIYGDVGWAGISDWLGKPTRQFRPFKQAGAFVRDLGLKTEAEWFAYCKSGKKPDDIPTSPRRVYADLGWIGMADWLGAGRWHQHRTFKDARAFVRALGLKSSAEWIAYCKSGMKPGDIPATPHSVYVDDGWIGIGDWLGTGTVAPHLRKYRSFQDARTFARSLGLKSGVEWQAYCKSGRMPDDIPATPVNVYANNGWAGIGDWLGTGSVSNQLRQFQSFKDARQFARRLGLKSWAQWSTYCKSGKKPPDIPSHPNRTYADTGWAGLRDWLGYVRSTRRSEPRSKKATAEAPAPADAST